MADKKVTQLTALASPNDEDLLLLVDDPNGTPVSKKIDVKTFVDPYLAMPNEVKQKNVVEAYKNYYINYKKDFAKWTDRKVPTFMEQYA